MQPIEQLSHILPAISSAVDDIQADRLNDSTPCSNFTVHDVLDHMMVLGGTFSYWFRGQDAPEILAPPVYGRVPAAEFREAMDGLLEAVKSPGAMKRTINAPVGEMSGSDFARFVAFDGLVHGWDIATATGIPYQPREDVIESVDEFARGAISSEMRDGDTFEAPTDPPSGASQLEALIAFSGRSI